ncbi:hypothetical protein D3C75_1229070 [compost metagenome]
MRDTMLLSVAVFFTFLRQRVCWTSMYAFQAAFAILIVDSFKKHLWTPFFVWTLFPYEAIVWTYRVALCAVYTRIFVEMRHHAGARNA